VETVTGVFSGRRLKTSDGWGPLSVREGIGPGYRFGFPARLGRGPLPKLGRMGCLGLFSYFYFFSSFSFSVSFISFITFAYIIQTRSNQFLNFCKIQGKVLNQQRTCFQNQNKVFNKRL
jgi:hypothetical protein